MKIKRSVITAQFPCNCQMVWDIVTNHEKYDWRSDLSQSIVIDELHFDEYTKKGFVTHFCITAKESCREYRFTMENQNMKGSWSGSFQSCRSETRVTFLEEVQVKNPIMALFAGSYLKRQQRRYISDLQAAVSQTEK